MEDYLRFIEVQKKKYQIADPNQELYKLRSEVEMLKNQLDLALLRVNSLERRMDLEDRDAQRDSKRIRVQSPTKSAEEGLGKVMIPYNHPPTGVVTGKETDLVKLPDSLLPFPICQRR